ncbi:hypothetical protein AAFF_G00201280 [Aldrovandia affinis]|uniref:C2H2-type domain-containing protein n=1 Tax=Aldrovandia affinis TaxID=143900 RepID=A0AAD7SWN0_9TELE|nr:hypothetical protein AAFF_G00201280 [Aldrovandia affinis]
MKGLDNLPAYWQASEVTRHTVQCHMLQSRQEVMSAVSKSRLGKRSPLGGLVCGPCSSTDGLGMPGNLGAEVATSMAGPTFGLGCQGFSPVKLYPGQRVYVNCCGQECAGFADPRNHGDNKASVFLPQQSVHTLRRPEEVWTAPTAPTQATPLPRPISSSINMPNRYRSPEPVDMDEIMAAMVLTSLSCSGAVQSPPLRDPTAASCEMECSGGEELSDSGSSGYWSWDQGIGSPAPSPSIAEADAHPADEGIDMELEQVLFDEPAARKRKNSVRLAYRCLWPNCGKVLTSVVGMKRHIRTLHLGHSSESEHPRQPLQLSPNPTIDPGPGTPPPSLLSQSAPDCYGQVRSEHLYQACPPMQVAMSPGSPCHWAPAVTVLQAPQAAPFRSRSVSVGEQWAQQHSALIRPNPASRSPPRGHCTSRRVRGEAKKCRKVYGIEHRDQWCTACRWKKACQRFVD